MLYLIFIYFFFNCLHFSSCQNRHRQNYQIEWNSSNTLFHSKASVLNVRLGDTIDFLCPHSNHSSTTEYNTLYLVSEIDYNLCFAKNYQPLFRCDQPRGSKRLIFTLSVSKYLPYPNTPEFVDGRSYYFISTSNGQQTGLEQKYDGLCRTRNFRLIIDVQKYYRRYSKNGNLQYRSMKLQNQSANQTNEQWLSSMSTKQCSYSVVFLILSIVLSW